MAVSVAFVVAGVTSGMWVQLSLLASVIGIFLATITLRKAGPEIGDGSGGRARVIALDRMPLYDVEAEQDLDEVA